MQPLIIAFVVILIALALAAGMIVQGHGCNWFEQTIRRLFSSRKQEENVPEDLQNTAYYLVMELGELLESEDDMEQYYGVKTIFNQVSALRAETLADSTPIPLRPTPTPSYLKVIK
jgi:hypothetical protein